MGIHAASATSVVVAPKVNEVLGQNITNSTAAAMVINQAAWFESAEERRQAEIKATQDALRPTAKSAPGVLGIMLVFITISMEFVAFVSLSDTRDREFRQAWFNKHNGNNAGADQSAYKPLV